jgi:mono/diheme cytochrome c family protein
MNRFIAILILMIIILSAVTVFATVGVENDPCKVLVPAELLPQLKAVKNPLPSSPKIIDDGKAIYEGKGACFTCHGLSGKGDGDAGKALDPAPRNLTNPNFQKCKSDGEMYWVIANGFIEEGLLPKPHRGEFIITEEETWAVIHYLRYLKGESKKLTHEKTSGPAF